MTIAYLDHNATMPIRPEAAAAVARALSVGGNPSSVHRAGREARRMIEAARAEVALLLGARPTQVIFTSGGTEANQAALLGLGADAWLVAAVEHDAVLRLDRALQIVPVSRSGIVDPDALAARLAVVADEGRRAIVALQLANNETGVLQPVADVVSVARAHGALVHCDAVQAVGKIAVDFAALGVDSLAVSAHKIGGPQGVGALLLRDGLAFRPLLTGGGQELGRRSGTENLAGIAGFGAAAAAAGRDLPRMSGVAALRDRLERRLLDAVPGARAHGAAVDRLPNTSCVTMPGVPGETQVMALDLAGVCISAGAACSSGKVRPSHVLRAMGLDEAEAASAVRFSLGPDTTEAEIRRAADAWIELYARRAMRAALNTAA